MTTDDGWDDAPMRELLADDDVLRVSVAKVEGRRVAVLVPASVGRLSRPQLELYSELQHLVLEGEEIKGKIREAVRECRDMGISWGALAWSLGITAEGARRRFIEDVA